MGRRTGEMSKSQLDRDFPYQIAVPADRCKGDNREKQTRFCADLSLAPRLHSVIHDEVTYQVFCFADPQHATSFQDTFGGQKFSPAARGHGECWYRWR